MVEFSYGGLTFPTRWRQSFIGIVYLICRARTCPNKQLLDCPIAAEPNAHYMLARVAGIALKTAALATELTRCQRPHAVGNPPPRYVDRLLVLPLTHSV